MEGISESSVADVQGTASSPTAQGQTVVSQTSVHEINDIPSPVPVTTVQSKFVKNRNLQSAPNSRRRSATVEAANKGLKYESQYVVAESESWKSCLRQHSGRSINVKPTDGTEPPTPSPVKTRKRKSSVSIKVRSVKDLFLASKHLPTCVNKELIQSRVQNKKVQFVTTSKLETAAVNATEGNTKKTNLCKQTATGIVLGNFSNTLNTSADDPEISFKAKPVQVDMATPIEQNVPSHTQDGMALQESLKQDEIDLNNLMLEIQILEEEVEAANKDSMQRLFKEMRLDMKKNSLRLM